MKPKLFIDRPILAGCISVLILMLGIIGLTNLPMEQYPDIAPPTVQVSATYTGASAETVQKSVIVPWKSINGVENMMYMTSSATNTGSATINVYFKQGTDPDMATVNVQNRVTKVQRFVTLGSNQDWCDGTETAKQPAENHEPLQPGRFIRPEFLK